MIDPFHISPLVWDDKRTLNRRQNIGIMDGAQNIAEHAVVGQLTSRDKVTVAKVASQWQAAVEQVRAVMEQRAALTEGQTINLSELDGRGNVF